MPATAMGSASPRSIDLASCTAATAGGPPIWRPSSARATRLLCEVSFGPGPVPPGAAHLDGPAVGELAQRAGVARVLLTHLLMGFDRTETIASVRGRFGGPIELVGPGDRFDLGSSLGPART